MCRCIKTMDILVGKERKELFTRGQPYHCVIKDADQLQVFYKIYGDEFDLSCTETEFQQHFVIINKKTGIKR